MKVYEEYYYHVSLLLVNIIARCKLLLLFVYSLELDCKDVSFRYYSFLILFSWPIILFVTKFFQKSLYIFLNSSILDITVNVPEFSQFESYSSYIEFPWSQTVRHASERFQVRYQFKVDYGDTKALENGLMIYAGQSTIGKFTFSWFLVSIFFILSVFLHDLAKMAFKSFVAWFA